MAKDEVFVLDMASGETEVPLANSLQGYLFDYGVRLRRIRIGTWDGFRKLDDDIARQLREISCALRRNPLGRMVTHRRYPVSANVHGGGCTRIGN